MDGESILPTLHQAAAPWRSSFLLERGKMTFERYAKVRCTDNFTFVSKSIAFYDNSSCWNLSIYIVRDNDIDKECNGYCFCQISGRPDIQLI
jgi:hypothetical protein